MDKNRNRAAMASLISTISMAVLNIAWADTIIGKVVAVADGDTLTVLNGREEIKVRLNAIDAPEKKQPFGTQSKQALSDLCFGQMATIETHGNDRYGRTFGDVTCKNRSATDEQVRSGMAWVYVKYAPKNSTLYAEEKLARGLHAGLWAETSPAQPWEWRKQNRDN